MADIPIITYEFAVPGDERPIKVHGMQEYRSGDHSGRVDFYLILQCNLS